MKPQTEKILNNSLTDLVAGVKMSTMLTGGSDLASYGTIAFNNNYSLLTLNRVILTYLYTSSGIIQRAIQLPVLDAMSRGIEIESGEMSADDIDELLEEMESAGDWETLKDAFTWARLYGGAGLVLNSNQEPTEPLNLRRLKGSPVEFYDLDRWQFDNSHPYAGDFEDYFLYGDQNDQFYVYGMPIHESRIIRIRNKRAPYYVRRQLRGWGMSEAERMIPPLNLYLKTQNVLYEILDESKIDVFRLKGFNEKLLQKGSTEAITQRVQLANELKNYVNALILDMNDEYEQKSMSFGGLAEISNENRIGIAAALTMPVTKLFGLSASGFNTGESDLENYNSMVEADVRTPMRPTIRRMLEIRMANKWGYVPSFRFTFPSLRVLSAKEEEEIKTSQTSRHLALYDRGLIDAEEVGQAMRQDNVLGIETKMEKGQVPNPEPPNGPEAISQFPGAAVTGNSADQKFDKVMKEFADGTLVSSDGTKVTDRDQALAIAYSESGKKKRDNSLTWSGHKLQGRMNFQGMPISIENRKGSVREGIDADGKPWKTKFEYPYGYIRGSVGTDGDHADCYIGPDKDAPDAFIIHQNVPETGEYDEDKIMLGFRNQRQAVKAYKDHYNKRGFFGGVKKISVDELKDLLKLKKGKKL